MDRPFRVLSIQENGMGHGTSGGLMRSHFAESSCQLDAYWLEEEREFHSRLLLKLLALPLPGQQNRRRTARFEWGLGYMARRLAARKLARAAREGWSYAAMHFHTQVIAYASADLMRRVPAILSGDMTAEQMARGAAPDLPPDLSDTPNRRLESRVFAAAKRVVFLSEWAARSAIQEGKHPADRFIVIPPGVDTTALRPGEDRGSAPEKSPPVRLLFVGFDWERKGGPDLLEVFLRQFTEKAELHILTTEKIECAHPRVHIHRGVKAYSPEWLAAYRGADIYVMPTRREAFGVAFIEAMAVGLPVIATRINAIPEIVEHGETGLLIQPGNRTELAASLGALIDNPGMRRRFGIQGRLAVEQKFDARAIFARWEALFRSVAAENALAPA